jgi:hypothetical protein
LEPTSFLQKQLKYGEEPLYANGATAGAFALPPRRPPPSIAKTDNSSAYYTQNNTHAEGEQEVQLRRSRLQRQEATSYGPRQYPSQIRMGVSRPATLNLGRPTSGGSVVGRESSQAVRVGLTEARGSLNRDGPKVVGVRQKVTDL